MGFDRRGAAALVVLAAVAAAAPAARSQESPAAALVNRAVEPVVLTGADVPAWSRLPAAGVAQPWPVGALTGERTAHGGVVVAPPVDARAGIDTGRLAAFRWEDGGWVEVPVQVDERFPYALANPDSDFGIYSATDRELTYAWDVESWRKTAGECAVEYPAGVTATPDPVPGLDDDDEIVFMASDAGAQAPPVTPNPPGADAVRHEVALVDPLAGTIAYVYLVLRDGGSAFTPATGYVRYVRDGDADQWIDRHSFAPGDPEQLGSSNTGYGPNLAGTVCDPDGTVRSSTDRFPRDGVTVSTGAYRWRATGRWMVREMHVARPGEPGVYGPDLIDRWKGRAFQQSPDSTISLVGFEDEQVNWEANSALLGERAGPVRAIREVWGADSGTNVTKTETFYRDAVTYRYRLRVHPIPPDGLYTSWDYNAGVAVRYFNAVKQEGVDIDGVNDDTGNVDAVGGQPAFFDVPDPTFDLPSALLRWEQVSGAGDAGSLVYIFENKGATSFSNPLVVPYYRDDKCLDDGTGDDPVPRPWPGEASTDQRVRDGYSSAAGGTPYDQLTCDQKQGAWGSHGIHFFATGDTDNLFVSPTATTEVDGQQWQFAVPTEAPANVGEPYAQTVRVPLRPVAAPQDPAVAATVLGGGDDPEPAATSIEVTGATEGQATDEVTLAARLTTDDEPVSGATLRFTLQGVERTAVTDDDGTARASLTLAGPAGPTAMRVDFDGDEERRLATSSRDGTFTVHPDDSRLTVSARRDRGAPVARVALADDDSDVALAGRAVGVLVDGEHAADGTTGPDGAVDVPLPRSLRRGAALTAVFDGDADGTYAGAEATTTWDGRAAPATTGSSRRADGEPVAARVAAGGLWALAASAIAAHASRRATIRRHRAA